MTDSDPVVSFVVPAYNEEGYLPTTLRSIRSLETNTPYEIIVVDGGSDDATQEIAESFGVTVFEQEGDGVGTARHQGAKRARGEWIAFIDADTSVRSAYLDVLSYADKHAFVAVTVRCRVSGPYRAKLPEVITNYLFPLVNPPVLPGFNVLVEREAYYASGGFPNVPNEDRAFSRKIARIGKTGCYKRVLVETSGRRIAELGLTGTALYYLFRDDFELFNSVR